MCKNRRISHSVRLHFASSQLAFAVQFVFKKSICLVIDQAKQLLVDFSRYFLLSFLTAIASVVWKSSWGQTAKGIVTAGM